MSTEANNELDTAETSAEEKFLGVRTKLADMNPPDDEGEEKIEVVTEPLATAEKPAEKPVETEDDIENYSDKVQKRINKLTWQAKEAARQKDDSEKLRDEAIRYAQSVNQQNKQQAHIISTGEAQLVDRVKAAANLQVETSRQKYKTAYTEGDADAILVAQEEVIQAQANQMAANNYDSEYQQRVNDWTVQQQYQQQQQQRSAYLQQQQPQQQPAPQDIRPQKPTGESSSWAEKNPWFGNTKHRDMTAIAYAKHESLVLEEGIKPDTKEYFNAIDSEVRSIFPKYFASESQQKPSTVVAPGSRNNGGKPRQVHLEPRQVRLAKKLGITLEQYAAQIK